jgi:hypothetical protein
MIMAMEMVTIMAMEMKMTMKMKKVAMKKMVMVVEMANLPPNRDISLSIQESCSSRGLCRLTGISL